SIALRTSATNVRTSGVSSTSSSATRCLRDGLATTCEVLQAAEREVGGGADAEPPEHLQPGLRHRVVDADRDRNGGERRGVDAVQIAIAAVGVEERRHVEAAALHEQVVGEHDAGERRRDVAEVRDPPLGMVDEARKA